MPNELRCEKLQGEKLPPSEHVQTESKCESKTPRFTTQAMDDSKRNAETSLYFCVSFVDVSRADELKD